MKKNENCQTDTVKGAPDTVHCVQVSSGNTSTYVSGHSGHSSFIEKMIIKKLIGSNIRSNKYEENNRGIHYVHYVQNGINAGHTSTYAGHGKDARQAHCVQAETGLDPANLAPRFRSRRFRTAVRLVLESFGLEPNFGNFKTYDKKYKSPTPIDWLAFAHNLLHPVFGKAKCFILDGEGQRVIYQDKPQYNICEIRANSESEAVELIQSRGYEFGGFLSEVGFDKELRARGGMVRVKSLPENTVALVFG